MNASDDFAGRPGDHRPILPVVRKRGRLFLLSSRCRFARLRFELRGTAPSTGETAALELKLERKARGNGRSRGRRSTRRKVNLRVRQSGQTYTRTFRSSIDGSVQYYAVVPALPARPAAPADSFSPFTERESKASVRRSAIRASRVCTSSHRPIAVLMGLTGKTGAGSMRSRCSSLLSRTFETDPQRTYLTGHSMGGHGTWHLGVTFPDRFAAIAPSAGWISMWSYAGARRATSASPIDELMARALGPSDTLALSRNLARLGVYILHGDADDNVPVGQARQMRQVLGEFHPDFAYHEQPGAGHWWGNACVDWPPLIRIPRRITGFPAPSEVRKIDFVTASPAVSSRAHWLSIESQLKALLPSKVHIELDPEHRSFEARPKTLHGWHSIWERALPDAKAAEPFVVELDGQTMPPVSAGLDAIRRQSDDLAGSHRRHVVGQPVATASVPKRPSPPGAVQGGVSQPIHSRLRNQGDTGGERVVARPGPVRRRDVLVPRQRLGRHCLGRALPRARARAGVSRPQRHPLRSRGKQCSLARAARSRARCRCAAVR